MSIDHSPPARSSAGFNTRAFVQRSGAPRAGVWVREMASQDGTSTGTFWRVIAAFVAAVLATAVVGAVVQTQFNLAALQSLGLEIPLAVRLRTTGQDIAGFGAVWGVMAAVALLFALPVAAGLSRFLPRQRSWLYALAGFAGLLGAIVFANALAPVPALIAATREVPGTLLMSLSGSAGGLIFARFTARR